MTFVSYAQNFEDVLLWRALRDVERGRYLDIGAQDPVMDSVSMAFYEAGWRGVHVEPTPAYAEKLREARPGDIVIQAAVSDTDQPIEFYEFPETGLSTGKAAIAERHSTAGFERRKIIVPSIKLANLLDIDDSEFHWVKIDVEGMEPEVLRSWGSCGRRPWVWVVEATYPLSQEPMHEAWAEELCSRDYREVHFDGLSRYFLHESQAARRKAFAAPANIFDGFAITRRHFSAVSLRNELSTVEQRLENQEADADHLRSQLEATQRLLIEEQGKAFRAQEALMRAAEERDAAQTRQMATYNDWVNAEREHREQVERLSIQWEKAELRYRDDLERHRLEREAAEGSFRQTNEENERQLQGALESLTELRDRHDQLLLEDSKSKDRLAAAESLIARALALPASRWQRLGQTLGFVRDEPTKVALDSWKPDLLGSNDQPLEHEMSIVRSPEVKLYLHSNSLAELLSLDGDDFVRSAYATMLGREADPEGEAYYASRREAGISKLQILHQMRRSPEAKLLLDPLPGLDKVFREYRFYSWFRGRKAAAEAIETRVGAESGEAYVQQFMQYHDEEFVRVVFLYYLGRDPDQLGQDYYTKLLRKGVSRQQILVDISKSRESVLRGRRAVGQDALKTAIALDRIPIIGTIISIIKFNFGIRNHLRDMRAMQNHLYRFSKKVG